MQRQEDDPYHITFEIVNRQCKGLGMLKDSGIQHYSLSDVRSIPGGLTRHLIRVPSKRITDVPTDKITRIRSGGKPEQEAAAWFDSDGCDVCKAILSHRAFLISGRHIEGHTILYSFVAPSFDAFQSIVSDLEANGLQPKILEVSRFKPRRETLTEKQERVLWLALKMGFFEFPRKITMRELARRLGIGLSTISEITRRGLRRLLEKHFET